MSINAINSVSLYEYYYSINQQNSKKKTSPLADEMKKYGLTPTEDEEMNIALLKRAKALESTSSDNAKNESISYSDRPWADLMYQLNLPFNEEAKDDIEDIKNELAKLLQGVSDNELEQEVKDLENYVEKLYLNFTNNSIGSASQLTGQLYGIAILNQASLL